MERKQRMDDQDNALEMLSDNDARRLDHAVLRLMAIAELLTENSESFRDTDDPVSVAQDPPNSGQKHRN